VLARSRSRAARVQIWFAAWLAAGAFAVQGCSAILGLDSGKPLSDEDAAPDAAPDGTRPEASVAEGGFDATLTDAEAPDSDAMLSDAEQDQDAPADAPLDVTHVPDVIDACTPEPAWCDLHCGTGPDNCGESRVCNPECALGYVCGSSNFCQCQTEPDWCTARCGETLDNCGNPIDCGPCDAGPDVVVCAPEDIATACGAMECGQATNNCGQLVNCGPGNLSSCGSSAQFCQADGSCCTPDNAGACGTHCGAYTATNGCGQTTSCPAACGGSQVCFGESCCTPANPCGTSCATTMTDNCGETVQCSCQSGQECIVTTCCTPSGCSANCLDSCGVYSQACCLPEAGPPDASPDATGPVDAAPETGSPETGTGSSSGSSSGVGSSSGAGSSSGGGVDATTGSSSGTPDAAAPVDTGTGGSSGAETGSGTEDSGSGEDSAVSED
jgi:hypothetical protein